MVTNPDTATTEQMAKKNQFYVVWVGRQPGIYPSWDSCHAQVDQFEGARYMGFPTREAAQEAYAGGWQQAYASHRQAQGQASPSKSASPRPTGEFLAVDAACSGNPGLMEYRGVYLPAGNVVFHRGPWTDGTNNIGEFLAIVHVLALQTEKGTRLPVYSDSANALLWVRKKKCGTRLAHTGRNEQLFDMIARAERWLETHDYSAIPLHKWDTSNWGELPADFGRK